MIWQWIAFGIAVGVMVAPDALGFSESVADAFHILGPVAASIGGMAAYDVLRGLRRAHLLVGPAIALAPILLGGDGAAVAVGVVAGLALALLGLPGAPPRGKFGGGWKMVFGRGRARTAGTSDRR
ncbi:MAG: hypothetical protein KY392_05195 [Chloroflexi bacterium]|nr:hypothetical protein [Chloroflexota bacterium]